MVDIMHVSLQAAKARACGNLGNTYSEMKEYSEAIRYYQQSLDVANDSNNLGGQAQVCMDEFSNLFRSSFQFRVVGRPTTV